MSGTDTPHQSRRQLRLGAFLMGSGHHIAAWRHPDSPSIAGLDFQHFAQAAQAAEAAKFDLVFPVSYTHLTLPTIYSV